MSTMSHTPTQRKLWHAGKRKKNETKSQWFSRVIAPWRGKSNNQGAYTPAWMKRGIFYKALDS